MRAGQPVHSVPGSRWWLAVDIEGERWQGGVAPALLLVPIAVLLVARGPLRLAAQLHAIELLPVDRPAKLGACMVNGGAMGGFGAGKLEHLRRWLGTQRAGLSPGSAEPPGAARRALRRRGSRPRALRRGDFDHAAAREAARLWLASPKSTAKPPTPKIKKASMPPSSADILGTVRGRGKVRSMYHSGSAVPSSHHNSWRSGSSASGFAHTSRSRTIGKPASRPVASSSITRFGSKGSSCLPMGGGKFGMPVIRRTRVGAWGGPRTRRARVRASMASKLKDRKTANVSRVLRQGL